MRSPDFMIRHGEQIYMRRWYIIPRNKYFNIYLHNMVDDDDPRALHDHPWWNISIVLKGGYFEWMPSKVRWRRPGSIIFRRATDAHRLSLDSGTPSWSLFITGRNKRVWGFWCPKGWIPFDQFIRKTPDGNEIGAGCG